MGEYRHIANIRGRQGVPGRIGSPGLRGPEGPEGPEGQPGLPGENGVDSDEASAQRIRNTISETHAALAERFVTAAASEHGITLFQNGEAL